MGSRRILTFCERVLRGVNITQYAALRFGVQWVAGAKPKFAANRMGKNNLALG
jgi:hypothetical protein